EHGGADTGGHRGASRLAADHWMSVERGARAVGDFAGERQQVEAVARREEAEEFVLGHDLAVRAEAPRARNRITVPRRRPRGVSPNAALNTRGKSAGSAHPASPATSTSGHC